MFVQVYFSGEDYVTDGINGNTILMEERRAFRNKDKGLQSVISYCYATNLYRHKWYKTEHWKLIDQTRTIQRGF